jgi:predicted DsbA family dithiol-disulfide isomerase
MQEEVGDMLEVSWHAFLLRPAPSDRSLEAFTRYTEGWMRPAASEPAATFRTWSGEHAPPSHSMPPAIAGKAVRRDFGDDAFHRFHLALMRAYFADNRTVSDRAVVLDVARACGLDTDVLTRTLDTDEAALEAEVVADHRDALHRGIAAVPTVVVNDEYVLPGAMTVAQYHKVVARLGG